MTTTKKGSYAAPTITVVSFKMEKGFVGTLQIGKDFGPSSEDTKQGTETYEYDNTWTAYHND